MAIQVGDKAPQFTLTSDSLESISLSDYSGQNVVLIFFPLAFTGVCTEELCTMRDGIADYANLDAQILAVSVDSPFTLQQFKTAESLNFPLLSDFNKEVARNYGAIYEEFVMGMRGVAKRSAFVVDKDGIVRYAEVLEDAGKQPDYGKIKAALQALA
jgi:peroxiredoxin